jgi:hypothetical protein
MEWQIIVAIAIMTPVIIIPVLLVWYLNLGGIYAAIKEARARRAAQQKETKAEVKVEAK